MTPAGLIGMALAAVGALILLGILIGLVWHQALFGVGFNSRTISISGFIGIVGFGLLVSGLRIMSNSRND
ncbi:MAG: hypothetical protein J7494_01245 [Sphingobium sp.]|nr:hypothetical protein [Sphingobium sp.]